MTSSKFGHIFPSWQSPLRFERYNTVLQDVAGKAHPKNINQQTFTPDVQIWSLPPKDWLGVQALLGIFVIWDPKPPRPNPMSSDLGTKPRTKRAGSPAPHEVRWNAPWPVLPEHHRSWAITPAGQAQGAKSCVKGRCCRGRNWLDFTFHVSSFDEYPIIIYSYLAHALR